MSWWMNKIDTALGPLAWRTSGHGPAVVFFAGVLANHELWRDVITLLEDRHRCIALDLPLGAHPWPMLPGADLSADSLAWLMLDCLDLLDLRDVTLVANDTAGGLALLALAGGHPALRRVGRLVLTNCPSYQKFSPPPGYVAPSWYGYLLGRAGRRRRAQRRARSSAHRALEIATAAKEVDDETVESFYGPLQRDRRIADDFVTVMAGLRPELLVDAAAAIPRFAKPVLLVWGDSCDRYGVPDARRLVSEFPDAAVTFVPGAKTWVPLDAPAAVAEAIAGFVRG